MLRENLHHLNQKESELTIDKSRIQATCTTHEDWVTRIFNHSQQDRNGLNRSEWKQNRPSCGANYRDVRHQFLRDSMHCLSEESSWPRRISRAHIFGLHVCTDHATKHPFVPITSPTLFSTIVDHLIITGDQQINEEPPALSDIRLTRT